MLSFYFAGKNYYYSQFITKRHACKAIMNIKCLTSVPVFVSEVSEGDEEDEDDEAGGETDQESDVVD